MSAFLGPVHHWLYGKIKYQEKLTQELLKKYDKTKESELESRFGSLTKGELEDIINHKEIHQWLNVQVQIVEKRLAYLVEEIENDKFYEIAEIFYNEGQLASLGQNYASVQEAFTELNKHLLDGMPCDKGVRIISQTGEEIIFEYNPALHQAFKDYQNFMALRLKWIKGFLQESKISVEQVGETLLKLKMEE